MSFRVHFLSVRIIAGLSVVLAGLVTALPALAQESLHEEVTVRQIATVPDVDGQQAVRIVYDPVQETLYMLTTLGNIYQLDASGDADVEPVLLYTEDDHGTPRPPDQPSFGIDVGPDGTIYLVGNETIDSNHTRAVIRRGVPTEDGGHAWSTVAVTEPYRFSHTWFDHRFSGIAVSPDGQMLYVNSGSRTDHGEMYDGIREEGLTAAIFQIPADGDDLTLPNDRDALREQGYLFADGTRNAYDLTFAPNGDLFGTENAGDRDDSEELNWLREGRHYGFPWRIGTNDTPMQHEGYDPDDDACVQPDRNTNNMADTGWYFSNDPDFPDPPEGVTFTDPIPNRGPDADNYRDCETGEVYDASEEGVSVHSFTSHLSPLGLVFDQDSVLADPFEGGAFVLNWNSSQDQMLQRLNEQGEDLLYLDLEKTGDAYEMQATRIAEGFNHPIDAAMVGTTIYVVEHGPQGGSFFGGTYGVFAVTLPDGERTATDDVPAGHALQVSSYPNPFQDRVTVQYTLSRPAHVRAAVYDVLGREVATLVDEQQATGRHTATFTGAGLAGGFYLCRITAGDETQTLTLVRVP